MFKSTQSSHILNSHNHNNVNIISRVKKMINNNKKAQSSVNGLSGFIMALGVAAIVLAVVLLLMPELQMASLPAGSVQLQNGSYVSPTQSYSTTTNSTDFMAVNTTAYRALYPVGQNITFSSMINVTPRLNFTREYTQAMTAAGAGGFNALTLRDIDAASVNVSRGGITIIANGNWTVTNTTPTRPKAYIISWTAGGPYNSSAVNVTYNRTWVKNVDNIYGTYAYDICGNGCALMALNASGSYGATVGWTVLPTYGINASNWAVEWSYTTRTQVVADSAVYGYIGQTTVKMGTIPTWIGLIIIAGLAFLVLGYFMRRDMI